MHDVRDNVTKRLAHLMLRAIVGFMLSAAACAAGQGLSCSSWNSVDGLSEDVPEGMGGVGREHERPPAAQSTQGSGAGRGGGLPDAALASEQQYPHEATG